MKPTREQDTIIQSVGQLRESQSLKTIAYAGTGKTFTLSACARHRPDARILYLVYNRAMAKDAKKRLPENTVCQTAHSLAWRSLGHPPNLSSRPLRGDDVAEALSLPNTVSWGGHRLGAGQAGVAILETIRRFWASKDGAINRTHAWYGPLIPSAEVATELVSNADLLWQEMLQGHVPIEHDAYLKTFQLDLANKRRPAPDVDLVFFDEAQDANPVLHAIVEAIENAGRVFVGDPYQQIYAWRGAINALDYVQGETHALTVSHRFGPLIAEYATHLLSFHSRAPKAPVRSSGRVDTQIGVYRPGLPIDAILCRTRAGVLKHAIEQQHAGRSVYVVGGVEALSVYIRDLAMIAIGRPDRVRHRDLIGIETWSEAAQLAHERQDHEMSMGTKLVEEFGARALLDTLDHLRSEARARPGDIAISTVHRAKGREWDRVALSDDLCSPADILDALGKGRDVDEEVDIAYVAATRAKKLLLLPEAHFRRLPTWERETRPSSPLERAYNP